MVISNNQQGTSKAYTLEIGGIDYLNPSSDTQPFIPVDVHPITWSDEVGNGVGDMTVVVYDPNPLWSDRAPLRNGQDVRFKTTAGHVIFGGTLVRIDWSKAIAGRFAELRIVSYDAWLDWRMVPRLRNKKNRGDGKSVRFNAHDDQIIKRMFGSDRRHGPLTTQGGFVTRTTHASQADNQMGKNFHVKSATLRTALEEISDEANYDGVPRNFYVDYHKRLHYYKRREDGNNGTSDNPAPFRLTSQDYITHIGSSCTATLVEGWPMHERPSQEDQVLGTFHGINDVGDLTYNDFSAITDGTTALLPNSPGYLPINSGGGERIEGDAAVNAATCADLGDTFTLEYWFRLDTLPSTASKDFRLTTSTGGSDDWAEVHLISTDEIRLQKRGGGGIDVETDNSNLAVDTVYHLVISHSPGNTDVMLNGVELTYATEAAKVFGSATAYQATHDGGGGASNAIDGDFGFHAVYSTAMSAAEALVHYRMGQAIVPEDHTWSDDSEPEVHAVYVKGKNAKGSGWVGIGNAAFTHNKQAYITRRGSDTSNKKRKKGKGFLRRKEDRYTGSFTVTDPDHAVGWRSGQALYSDDDGIGLTSSDTYWDGTARQPYEVVSVRGEMSGGQSVRLDIDYGVLRRTMLRALARRRR